MPFLAGMIYRTLVWKERRRARGSIQTPGAGASSKTAHLAVGERGESLAYWYLRQAGYLMVARNRRVGEGELDLIGWDGPVLAFVEVKTRSTDIAGPPELAVNHAKRKLMISAAHNYMRRMPRRSLSYRFDIASVAWDSKAGFQVRLIKNAFQD